MIKALDFKTQQQEMWSGAFILRCSHCRGEQHTKEPATDFHPDSWSGPQQGVCLRAGDCPTQRPHPEWLQGDPDRNGGSEQAQWTAVWGASGVPPAPRGSAGYHQVEARPHGWQTVSEFQILEARQVPHACAQPTPREDTQFGFPECPGAIVLALVC